MAIKVCAIYCLSLGLCGLSAKGVFYVAGRHDLPFFWAIFGVQILALLAAPFMIDPDLVLERLRPRGKDEDPLAPWLFSLLYVLHLIVAALDVGRYHLSCNIPDPVKAIAVIGSGLGWAGLLWVMKTNRFFSSAIRLQKDRGQEVVTTGPYRLVRHPGYATMAIAVFSQAIALGSWLSLIPIIVLILVMAKRTLFEEAFLLKNLAGYEEYSHKVRFRWCPRIW